MANQEGLHFSVSHSGRLWACAAGTQPIGIDLERYREGCPAEAIARRFFHPEEYVYLKNHGFSSDSFFPLWTAKESYVKYTGEGISDLYSSFSVVENRALCGTVNGVHYRHFPVEQGYSLCVCTQAPPSVQFVFL